MQFTPLGDSAVLIRVEVPSAEAAIEVQRCSRVITTNPFIGLIDVVPSYETVAVFYDPVAVAHERPGSVYQAVCGWITERLQKTANEKYVAEAREWIIPVVYGGEFGPDLEDVARRANLTPADVVRLHSGATYVVRAVGFSPGFPFLSGLPAQLCTPRRATPRTRVPAGTVGIGGEQTGIYGITTPGGWNLIGRTHWVLFDAAAEPPCLLAVGDRVRFRALPPEAWAALDAGPLMPGEAKEKGHA